MSTRHSLFATTFALASLAGAAGCGSSASMVSTAKSPSAARPAKSAASTPAVTFTLVDAQIDPWVLGSIDRRIRSGQTRGHERVSVPFELADLPTVTAPPLFEDKDAPAALSGQAPSEIQIKKNTSYGYGYDPGGSTYNSVSIVGSHFTSGIISIGGQESAFAASPSGPTGGLSIQCAPWSRVVAAHWEGLVARNAGEPQVYELVDGWFDMKACKLVEARRTQVKMAELLPGTLFAYRQCDDSDCSHPSATFVIPNATNAVSQNGPLRSQRGTQLPKFALPIRRGMAESLLVTVPPATNSTLHRSLAIEIAQGTADEAPIATAFVADQTN